MLIRYEENIMKRLLDGAIWDTMDTLFKTVTKKAPKQIPKYIYRDVQRYC